MCSLGWGRELMLCPQLNLELGLLHKKYLGQLNFDRAEPSPLWVHDGLNWSVWIIFSSDSVKFDMISNESENIELTLTTENVRS